VTYGGDSGNRIFVLYWRCSLIRVSVIRGSTVIAFFNKKHSISFPAKIVKTFAHAQSFSGFRVRY
jgi:hypothetical protein